MGARQAGSASLLGVRGPMAMALKVGSCCGEEMEGWWLAPSRAVWRELRPWLPPPTSAEWSRSASQSCVSLALSACGLTRDCRVCVRRSADLDGPAPQWRWSGGGEHTPNSRRGRRRSCGSVFSCGTGDDDGMMAEPVAAVAGGTVFMCRLSTPTMSCSLSTPPAHTPSSLPPPPPPPPPPLRAPLNTCMYAAVPVAQTT
eukprot:COSAG01_NODE_6558_length_3609_cov_6.192877_2_plen_200_part_00